VLAHTSLDIAPPSTARIIEMIGSALDEPYVARSADQVSRLLSKVDLMAPGLVPIEHWRNDGDRSTLASGHTAPLLGAVGRIIEA
jgi:hypothetical protein